MADNAQDMSSWDPSQPDRRMKDDRRGYVRGGRRRTDWPADAVSGACPRCESKEVKFIEATPSRYFWECHRCKYDWSMRRDTPKP
jgi:ssDNA-binding Zn-finger/Zn-ribbon topoisomerase 1